jgi:hypothetical protein
MIGALKGHPNVWISARHVLFGIGKRDEDRRQAAGKAEHRAGAFREEKL